MEKALQIFTYGSKEVRTIDENGDIWFVAKDVAKALEYPESSLNQVNNLFSAVPNIWAAHKRIMVRSDKTGIEQAREVLCISEQGLYFFLGRSDKPKALPFQMWLAGEVLPSIRRTGAYVSEQALMNPEFIRSLSARVEALEKDNKEYREYIVKNMPATTVGRLFLGQSKAVDFQEASHFYQQLGLDIGFKRLYARERDEKGYLCARKGRQRNRPTHRAIELGLYTYQIGKNGNCVTIILPKRLAQIYDELLAEQRPILFKIEEAETSDLLASDNFIRQLISNSK